MAPRPSAETLEGALRRVINNIYVSGNLEELTVKRVRRAAEEEFYLEEGFFKRDEEWGTRSKVFISGEVEAREDNGKAGGEEEGLEEVKEGRSHVGKKKGGEKKANGVKRKQKDTGKSRKRRKTDSDDDGASSITEDEGSKLEDEDAKSPRVSSTKVRRLNEDQEAEEKGPKPHNPKLEQSESEMSVLDDDGPRRKKKQKSKGRSRTSDSTEPSNKKRPLTEKQKSKPSSKEPADPNQEEIKRLQGWLVKCGIRKMWWKELQPYESPKAKIAHLKEMLTDAGMVGRFSQEKASQIREERELKADLEAVQEGAKIWGKENEAVDTGGARPRRQLAKGLQELDFLNDDDGEESD